MGLALCPTHTVEDTEKNTKFSTFEELTNELTKEKS